MRNGTTLLGTTAVQPKLGAGGFLTGGVAANDGTMLVRTDTHNAYSRGPNDDEWKRELRPGENCNASDLDIFYNDPYPWGATSTYDVAIAPTNSAVRYLVCMGYVWRTQDAAASYVRLPLAQQSGCDGNQADSRKGGKPLEVDVQNPAHVWFGSPSTGVRYSHDSGATWTLIPTGTLPLPVSPHRYNIACDPSSSVVNGRKQGWYVHVQGSGQYRTQDGGATWAKIANAPSNPTLASHMKIDSVGRVWLTGIGNESQSNVRIFNGTSWYENTGKQVKTVAFSPHDGRVYSLNPGGSLDYSTDNGVTWIYSSDTGANGSRTANDIAWHEWTDQSYMANGDFVVDPIVDRLWIFEGIGAWRTPGKPDLTGAPATFSVVEASKGIENMVGSTLTIAPDGTRGYACHDRGGAILARGETFPATHGVDNAFQHGQAADYAPEDNAFWVLSSRLNRSHGWTPDRGKTWTRVDTLPTASGADGAGQLAVLSKDVWVSMTQYAVPPLASNVNANALYLTVNRGASWTRLTIGNNNAVFGQPGFGMDRRVLVKDRFVAGRFYFLNNGDESNPGSADNTSCRGIWRGDVNLSNGSLTSLTRISTTFPMSITQMYFYVKLTQIGANDWILSGGDGAPGLWRTSDFNTWTEVTGTDDQGAGTKFGEVHAFGVGKAAKGSSFQTFYAIGWRNGGTTASSPTGFGAWMSIDNGVTWQLDAQFLDGNFDNPRDCVGDPLEFGRFTICYAGSGIFERTNDYRLRAS